MCHLSPNGLSSSTGLHGLKSSGRCSYWPCCNLPACSRSSFSGKKALEIVLCDKRCLEQGELGGHPFCTDMMTYLVAQSHLFRCKGCSIFSKLVLFPQSDGLLIRDMRSIRPQSANNCEGLDPGRMTGYPIPLWHSRHTIPPQIPVSVLGRLL